MDRSVPFQGMELVPGKRILGFSQWRSAPMSKKTQVPSTTAAGAPAPSDRNSLTVGADGPLLLHDVHLIEHLAHFHRAQVIERKPPAKDTASFGLSEVTQANSKSNTTRAAESK